jgi:hypothetical protein
MKFSNEKTAAAVVVQRPLHQPRSDGGGLVSRSPVSSYDSDYDLRKATWG